MEEVLKFLKDCGTYYIATIDGDRPKVRPFGTINLFEGKLYFQTGKIKEVSEQIHVNPKIEICAFNGDTWVRIAAEAAEDDRREARVSMLKAYPSLAQKYHADDGNTEVLYLKNAVATFYSFTSQPRVIKF